MKQHYFIEITLEDYLPIREVIESSRKYAEQNGNRELIKYSREILTKLDACFQNKLEKKLNK
jgi:hypothetical protein